MARQRLAIVAALAFIAAATLIPAPSDTWQRDFWCIRCGGSLDPVELLLNVLLFVPFGLALRAARARWVVAIAVVVATTVSIEMLQYTVIVGRDGSIRDCVTNTVGGLLGFAIQPHAGALWRADGRSSRRLAWAASLLWIAHAAITPLLFRPSASPNRYYMQIAPRLGQFDAFTGTVLSATVNGTSVGDGPFPDELQATVSNADSIEIAAVATPGQATQRIAPVVNIADRARDEIAILARRGMSSVFQSRVLAQKIGLYAPGVVLDDAFASGGSTPVHLEGTQRGFVLRLSVTAADGHSREATLTLSPALGWALWWPFDYPSSQTLRWMTVLWLFVPLLVIGFWGAERSGTFVSAAAPALTAAIAAQGIVPLVLGQMVSWSQLGIAVLGVIVGLGLGLRSTPLRESLGP